MAFKPFGADRFEKKKKTFEADAASSFSALLRPNGKKTKESAGKISSNLRFTETEANPTPDTENLSRFRVVMIQEGLGNFGTCYYYTKQALQKAVFDKIFEGKKCFANHPDSIEEQTRPERDVKDIIGHFENVAFNEMADGRGQINADLVVLSGPTFDWARALMAHSLNYSEKYQDQDFIGLSINANGDATEVGLDQFMRENIIPDSVKPKLAEAEAKGITVIHPVDQLTSAESCDLVTEAGAGGRIAQMLEQEKDRMKKFAKMLESKETEAKEAAEKKEAEEKAAKEKADLEKAAKEAKDQETAPAPTDGGGDDAGDDDADQDRELLKSFLQKYLGDGHDEETYEMAKEAIQAGKEMGMDEDEAMKCAGYSMKMAKHMAGKKPGDAPAPGGAQPAPAPKDGAAPVPAPAEAAGGGDPSKLAPEAKKESEKRVLELTAEVAKLKETIKGFELNGCEGALDKLLRESKLPMAATKKFRECLGTAKSEQEIQDKLKIFKEAYGVSGEADPMSGFVCPEKTNLREASGGLDLSDCVKKQD